MKLLTCAAVQQRLAAYQDGELPLDQQVSVGAHLETCPPCTNQAEQLWRIGALLREAAAAPADRLEDVHAMRHTVLARVKAERDATVSARVARLFEDMHFVWAALSASAATAACAITLIGLWYFSPPERADSLAGILSALASPGSNRNPIRPDDRVSLPRVASETPVQAVFEETPPASEEDLVFALAAVVTQEGRVAHPELVLANRRDRDTVLRLMTAVSAARFEPASYHDGSPVAVNLVWLLTHTTVRAKKHS